MSYVLVLCASLLNGGCLENYVAYDNFRACEVARLSLKGEFDRARCLPADQVTIEPVYTEEE